MFFGLFYGLLAVVFTWPLVTHLSTNIASDPGDPVLSTWILWWNAHAVPLTDRWWNAPIFWPARGALGLSELLLGVSLFTTPMQWLGASPVTAYNVAVLLSFPLSALAAHALTFSLTRRHDAAVVAGLIYGFNPFRADHLSQLQVLTSYWMPLALFALHSYLQHRRKRWLALFAAAWLLQALSNGYYLLFFPLLVGLWVVWFVPIRRDPRALGAIAVAWAIGSLPLVPIALKYRELHNAFDFQRSHDEIVSFSANVASFLDTTPLLKFWHFHSLHQPEGALFPGLAPAALVAIAMLGWMSRARIGQRAAKISAALVAISLVFFAAGVSALVHGPWAVVAYATTLVSIGAADKPFSEGLLFLVAAMCVEPRIRAAFKAGSSLTFYVAATALLYLLTLGPNPKFLSTTILRSMPYSWLMTLPGFDALRVPARCAMVALVSFSAAAGLAFARLTQRAQSNARFAAAVAVGLIAVADGWMDRMPLAPLPVRLQALESSTGPAGILELPLGDVFQDASAMYRAMYHGRAIVNGYSGFFPKHYELLRYAISEGDLAILDGIAAAGPFEIVVDGARDPDGRWSSAIAQRAGVERLGAAGGRQRFSVPAIPRHPDLEGRSLPLSSVSVSTGASGVEAMMDGDFRSRWTTGAAQRGGETVTIDMGRLDVVTGITLTLGPHLGDYPRDLAIDTSEDGTRWENRWRGRTVALAFEGALRDPRRVPLRFALPPVPARWIRLTQNGSDRMQFWSITELGVFGR